MLWAGTSEASPGVLCKFEQLQNCSPGLQTLSVSVWCMLPLSGALNPCAEDPARESIIYAMKCFPGTWALGESEVSWTCFDSVFSSVTWRRCEMTLARDGLGSRLSWRYRFVQTS